MHKTPFGGAFLDRLRVDCGAAMKADVVQSQPAQKTYKWDIVWPNVILMAVLHAAGAYGFYLRLTSPHHGYMSSAVCKALGICSSLGITAGAHRLWTHKAYKANWLAQSLLMLMATMTYQNSIYIWARDHRVHHKYAETDADPHNAKRGFFFAHMGWLLVRKQPEVIQLGKSVDLSDLRANRIVMFQHRYYYALVLLCAVFLPMGIEHYALGVPWKEAFFIYTMYRYVLSVHTTWCINSLAHLYGYKPYDKSIGPTENHVMKVIGMGEGFHNYHHVYPWDYKAAEYGNDWRNTTTFFIDALAACGWVWDRRTVRKDAIDARVERTGDAHVRDLHMAHDGYKKVFHNLIYLSIFSTYIILA